MIHCSYTPKSTLPHTIEINYGTVAAADSPYRVYVSTPPDISKIVVSGEWFDSKPKIKIPTRFFIDTSAIEDTAANLDVKIVHEELSQIVPIEIKCDTTGIYEVKFVPLNTGHHSTVVHYGGTKIPQLRRVFVAPLPDVSKIVVSGLNAEPNIIGRLKEFNIDFEDMGEVVDCNRLAIHILDPKGNIISNRLTADENLMSYKVSYRPYLDGCHKISILYDDVPLPGSPFKINVEKYCEPGNCKAVGDGLATGITGIVSKFDIETREAGIGGLTLAIEGPAETKLECFDNKNGSCSVQYVPTEPGDYEISILFAHTHIPGSPFKVRITSPVRPEKVRIFGPAAENRHQVEIGKPTFFNIDVSDAGPGLIAVTMNNSSGIPVDNVMVVNKGGGFYTVNFIPPAENIFVTVKFAHQNVPSRYSTLNLCNISTLYNDYLFLALSQFMLLPHRDSLMTWNQKIMLSQGRT